MHVIFYVECVDYDPSYIVARPPWPAIQARLEKFTVERNACAITIHPCPETFIMRAKVNSDPWPPVSDLRAPGLRRQGQSDLASRKVNNGANNLCSKRQAFVVVVISHPHLYYLLTEKKKPHGIVHLF